MSKISKLLLMLIAMVVIMIAAVGIDKGIKYFDARKWEQERIERYEQAHAEVSDIQVTISELSQSQEAIEEFIEENKAYFEELEFSEPEAVPDRGIPAEEDTESISENELSKESLSEAVTANTVSENVMIQEELSEGGVSENTVSGNGLETEGDSQGEETEKTISENSVAEEGDGSTVSENGTTEKNTESTISENAITEEETESVSQNTLSEEGVSENALQNSVSENHVSQNSISGNELQGNPQITVSGNTLQNTDMTLQERRELSTSYIETQIVNERDKQIIANNTIDFSEIKIACLGDSITEAVNLEKMENYQQYAYPTKLGALLGAKTVYNLGIGGSSIGRYWENAFVDRYKEIPQDTNIIVVMGGTNDGFCVTREEFGNMQERKPRTFIGDLDELMRGLKADYPDAMIVFATPLPNVLHDMLRKERDYLLPQKEIVDAIKVLGAEHNFPVIDLYNSNILDSHDAAVIFNYMPDGVHGNEQGYQILAEHIAAELIGLYSVTE